MGMVLALSSPNSLIGILNAIFIGVIIYWATNKFTYYTQIY